MHRLATTIVLLLLIAATPLFSGCTATQGPNVLERLFPADPNESFFDDEAREIDRRLSSSSPKVEL